MTTPDHDGADGLRVGGWLPASRDGGDPRGPDGEDRAERRTPAHAAPDAASDDAPQAYAAPDFEPDGFEPARAAWPRHRAAAGRAIAAGAAFASAVSRYVYQGRRRFGEIVSRRRRRTRAAAIGVGALALLMVLLTATLAPDGKQTGNDQGLTLPTGQPPPALATAADGLGSATPGAPASPTAPRRTPSKSPPGPAVPPSPPPGPRTVYYEAEAALLIGAAEAISQPGASGGRIVHNIGTDEYGRSGQVSFTQVTAPTANRYALTVFYVSGENRYALLSVNNGPQQQLGFPSSGGWDVVGRQTFTIELSAGRNGLTFSNPYGWAPRLDRISILG